MKILNLYAGVGGNSLHWEKEDVTAVEYTEAIAAIYKQNQPGHSVIIADANSYLYENAHKFDFIWSSPPCQSHSKMVKATRHPSQHGRPVDMTLYQQIIWLQHFYSGLWVVENVDPYYGVLQPKGVHIKQVGRHVFWSNFDLGDIQDVKRPKGFINQADVSGKNKLQEWLGIHYDQNVYYEGNHCPAQILRNAVHPKIGEQILNKAKDKRGLKWEK